MLDKTNMMCLQPEPKLSCGFVWSDGRVSGEPLRMSFFVAQNLNLYLKSGHEQSI